ncbi:hypothetical protein, partial [Marinoscillum furvescens]|uniref:hypothetical protein n=1 Tax=Marinoscillum furvescens TaxID=1026 RepID=UPI001C86C54B
MKNLLVLGALLMGAINALAQQAVEILHPTEAEERKFGETIDIEWLNTGAGTSDYFQLYYSNDGATFQNFYNGYIYQMSNSGDTSTYTWTLPDLGTDSSSSIRVRVLNQTLGVADTSAGFRLYYEPEVAIAFPTDTVQRKFRETLDVTWVNGDIGTADYFSLYYSNDGATFQNFYNGYIYQLTNNGDTSRYTWTLPDLGADSSSSIRIRVLNLTRSVSDTSAGFRLYYEPEVAMVFPTDTVERKFKETLDVTWVNGDIGTADYFSLYYSNDGASFQNFYNGYIYQLSNSGDTSTFTWTLPDLGADSSSSIRIRVLNQTRSVSDTSEGFRVYYEPEVAMVFPTDTVERKFKETLDVAWVNGDIGTADYFSLYYSNDGATFQNFYNGYIYQLTNSGDTSSYTWTLPDLGADSSSSIRIRVLNQTRSVSDTSEGFRLYYEPEVNITSPAAGQYVAQSATHPVTWDNGDVGTADYFQLYYSVNGGNFTNIYNGYIYQFTADGTKLTYNWSVPAIESTDVKFRVLNQTRSVSDTTKSFTVCATCPGVALYHPNGGEQFSYGEEVEIGWSLGDVWEPTDSIRVELSLDAGSTYETPAIFAGNYSEIVDNKVNWTTPESANDQLVIRVQNVTQGTSDVSDNVFEIVAPVVAVTLSAPNGGESFTVGESTNITWTSTGIPDTDLIEIRLSTDGGTTYSILADGTFGTYGGTYSWTVPDQVTSTARIEIANTTQNVADASDANFSIVSGTSLTLSAPNGGESFTVGESTNITWTSAGIPDTDLIEIRLS